MASQELLQCRATETFIENSFELAADLYSQNIILTPTNRPLFADGTQANIKPGNLTDTDVVASGGGGSTQLDDDHDGNIPDDDDSVFSRHDNTCVISIINSCNAPQN